MINNEDVLAHFADAGEAGLSIGRLATEMGIKKRHRPGLKRIVDELLDSGHLQHFGGGRIGLIEQSSAQGSLQVHHRGFAFVTVDGGIRVFIPPDEQGLAIDGDLVAVDYWPSAKGWDGRVTDIIERGRTKITAVVERISRGKLIATPDDPRLYGMGTIVVHNASGRAAVGQIIVASISEYPDESGDGTRGKFVATLGSPGDPEAETQKILLNAGIATEFPDAVVRAAEQVSQEVTEKDRIDRADLRHLPFVTIDPDTARDFDDAVCCEETDDGYRVWVAVADVSHYVLPDKPMDKCAVSRGVSVYLPDRVIPMLPFELSSGICSLNPHVDRLAMVVAIDVTKHGVPYQTDFCAAVIHSKHRFTYGEVAKALDGGDPNNEWLPMLRNLDRISSAFRAKRFEDGSLDLDLPESKVILDEDDARLIRDIKRSRSSPQIARAYQLIEDFMIAANIAVGEYLSRRVAKVVWRVHEPPDPERLEEVRPLMESFGVPLDSELASTSIGLQKVLRQVARTDARHALSFALLRSLKQARYTTEPLGHFGLAARDYLHFTSPIRRYPDVLVHRLLKRVLKREGKPAGKPLFPQPSAESLEASAQLASDLERRALDAERETMAMYQCLYMRQFIGETYTGRVTGITDFGIFVEIESPAVDGLVKYPDMGSERFTYDPVSRQAIGDRTTIRLGDEMPVRLVGVSLALRRLDFVREGVTNEDSPFADDLQRKAKRSRRVADRQKNRKREQRGRNNKGKAARGGKSKKSGAQKGGKTNKRGAKKKSGKRRK